MPKLFAQTKLTRPSRQWLLVASTIGLAVAVALSMAFAGAADAKKKNKPKPVDLSSTVAQSGFNSTIGVGASAPLNNPATPFSFDAKKQFVTLTTVKITLTCDDCDTAPGDFDENNLDLGLDGIDTGIKLNGFPDNQTTTLTISGTPNNAAAIIGALNSDHKLNASIIKVAGLTTNDFSLPATSNTTLELVGTAKNIQPKPKHRHRHHH